MGILNVDNIQPVGGGTTITLNSSEINVGAGITLESNGQAIFAGIVTATHFYGSGANLTGLPAGTTINNNAANRIITGEGGTTLNGEANLLFDGGTLALNGRYQRGSATVQDGDAIAGGININGLDMDASVIMSVFGNDGDFTRISGSKSRNASVGSHTIVQNNDVLLSLKGFGSDGTNFEEAAQIEMQVDGSPGNDDMPGRIVFKTTADGASSPTEKLRIDSSGNVGINSSVIQRAYKTYNTPGYRYHSRADGFIIRHGGSGTNFTITGMNQGFASLRIGAYSEGQRVNFHADIGGYNAGNAGVRLYDSNEITNQATAYGSGSCSITVTKNNASYVVNVTQTNSPGAGMAGFYFFETGGYNSVSTLTIADT